MRLSSACVQATVRQLLASHLNSREDPTLDKKMYLAGRTCHKEARAVEVGAVQVGQRGIWPAAQLAPHSRRQTDLLTALSCITNASVGQLTAACTAATEPPTGSYAGPGLVSAAPPLPAACQDDS